MSDSFQSICQQFPWTSGVHSDETFSTETVHRTGIDHQPMFFNLTFTSGCKGWCEQFHH